MVERDVLADRISRYREQLDQASDKWGGVTICAVTKTVDAATINMAYDFGIRVIGENRVQELRDKLPDLNPGYEKHVIGQLQTNKVKYIIRSAAMIQSLDRMALAQEINRLAVREGVVMPALVQVNIAREPQKGGMDETEIVSFLEQTAELPGLKIKGLMAVMPAAVDPESVRPYFRRMRVWFDRLRDHPVGGAQMEILSMGMTHDCLVAAQEGATMVRIGSGLFGNRIYAK